MCNQADKMILLCGHVLLFCLFANAEYIFLYKESGDSVALRCSSVGCPTSIDGFSGMHLYQTFTKQEEVLYYFSKSGRDKITPCQKFKNRIQTNGPFKNHTITVSNLTVHDSGSYSCVYKKFPRDNVTCNVYILVVKGVPCEVPFEVPFETEKHPSLVLPVVTTGVATVLVILLCILLKVLVKKWIRKRRRVRVPPAHNDYVYEVMTKNGLRPLPLQETS